MPIYEYRCECGEVVEALVRGGREPSCGPDVGHYCATGGGLKKLISAHNVGHSGGGAFREAAAPGPGACDAAGGGCGSCGAADACWD